MQRARQGPEGRVLPRREDPEPTGGSTLKAGADETAAPPEFPGGAVALSGRGRVAASRADSWFVET